MSIKSSEKVIANLNRFEHKNRRWNTNPVSEYWAVRLHAQWDRGLPRFRESDRLRQEWLFISVFARFVKLEERTPEQQELVVAFGLKHEKLVKGLHLNGDEPSVTAEEFKYWGVRYPVG